MTPKEFSLMCEGYKAENKRKWDREQRQLYLLRFIGASIYNIGAGFSKEAKGIEPKELMPLPLFDHSDSPKPLDKQYFRKLIEKDNKKVPDVLKDRSSKSGT